MFILMDFVLPYLPTASFLDILLFPGSFLQQVEKYCIDIFTKGDYHVNDCSDDNKYARQSEINVQHWILRTKCCVLDCQD